MEHFIKELVREAGDMGKTYFYQGVNYTTKGSKTDLLTEADTALSDFMVEKIHSQYPDHHIKSEERTEDINAGAEYEWVIDPIDGTFNFAHAIPTWAVMLCLLKNGQPQMSCIYFPVSNELFFAELGKGATMNGKTIQVSEHNEIQDMSGVMYRAGGDHPFYGEQIDRYRQINATLALQTNARLCNYAAIAITAYVSSGAFQFAIGNSGADWDLLPTVLLAREAGAKVTDSDGNDWQRGHQDYIMAPPNLHKKIMELIKQQN